MNYLLLGEDGPRKQAKVDEIRRKFLSKPDALKFDHEILYSTKLDPQILKKAFLALPAISKKRVVLLHDCHNLTDQNKRMVVDFLSQQEEKHLVFVMESSLLGAQDAFVRKVKPFVECVKFESAPKRNVFDITNCLTKKRVPDALKALYDLLADGMHPLQIMGVMVWFWGKNRSRLSERAYEKGLWALSDADLSIKRSRVSPAFAMELLIVRLYALLG